MRGCAALAWRELRAQRVTSVLILLAVILSTTMTAAIGQSLGTLNALRLQQAASLNGNRHVTLHNLTAEQAQAISADERVAFAGRITALGTCRLENSSLTLLLREYDGGALSAYSASLKLAEGALPRAAGEIALPRDVLTLLGYSGGPGATLVLPLQISRIQDAAPSYSYTAEFTLTGIFESSYVGYVSRSVAGAAGPGSAAELLPERYQVYSLDLRLREPERLQETVDDLAGQFDLPQACIQYNDTLLDALGVSYRGKGASDAGGAGFPYLAAAGVLVAALVLLAAGLVIFNILKIAVAKRIRCYGTLRALGAGRGQLYALVGLQLLLLCGAGIPAGAVLGLLCAKGITLAVTALFSPDVLLAGSREELAALIQQNSAVRLPSLLLSGGITLLFAALAALPAARYAARVSPTAAMAGPALRIRRHGRRLRPIRSFPAFYARMNLKRSPGRTAITICSLVMSITVFVALQNFSGLLDASRRVEQMHLGDYAVSNLDAGFLPADVEALADDPAVSGLSTLKHKVYQQDASGALELDTDLLLQSGEVLHLVGLDDKRLCKLADGLSPATLEELLAGRSCLAAGPIPFSFDGETYPGTQVEAGMRLTVSGVALTVAGISPARITPEGEGFLNGVQVIVSDGLFDRLTGLSGYNELYLTLSEGTDRAALETRLDALCAGSGGYWLSYENTDRQLAESYAQISLLCWGLILFIGAIGVLNIVNTVFTNIHTRLSEIGVQRAIGMSTGDLYRTFLWEGVYYGAAAAVLGAAAGYGCTVLVQAAVTDTLQWVPFPAVPVLQAAAASLLACLLATCAPLRSVGRMDPVTAIAGAE